MVGPSTTYKTSPMKSFKKYNLLQGGLLVLHSLCFSSTMLAFINRSTSVAISDRTIVRKLLMFTDVTDTCKLISFFVSAYLGLKMMTIFSQVDVLKFSVSLRATFSFCRGWMIVVFLLFAILLVIFFCYYESSRQYMGQEEIF